MRIAELQEIAGCLLLSISGTKAQLVARIWLALHGQSDRHIAGLTRCRSCGAPVRVRGTRKRLVDGRLYIERAMRCDGRVTPGTTGRQIHRYQLIELVEEATKEASGGSKT